jgi:hypothetical protein
LCLCQRNILKSELTYTIHSEASLVGNKCSVSVFCVNLICATFEGLCYFKSLRHDLIYSQSTLENCIFKKNRPLHFCREFYIGKM